MGLVSLLPLSRKDAFNAEIELRVGLDLHFYRVLLGW